MSIDYGRCPKCDVQLHSFIEICPSCGTHLGFPNVRAASTTDEVEALNKRFQAAEARLNAKALSNELSELMAAFNNDTAGVVVSMPANVALNLVLDARNQYVNYERLVGSGMRTSASFANDAHRKVVAGAMFGSIGENIVYGALSLSGRGMKTYGDIYCKLKPVAIDQRTSFLEINSYEFVDKYGEEFPAGCRSNWENRAKLAAVKLEERNEIRKNQAAVDWEKCVLVCDGSNRNLDEYIEAHIYGTFNVESIEQLEEAHPVSGDANVRKLIEIVMSAFQEL